MNAMNNEDKSKFFLKEINKLNTLLAGTGYMVLSYQQHRRFDEVNICNVHNAGLCLRFISCDDNDYCPSLYDYITDFAMIIRHEKSKQAKIQDELDLFKVSDKASKNRKL